MQSASLSKSAHSSVSCYDCHLVNGWWSLPGEKVKELTVMYPARAAGRPAGGSAGSLRLPRTVCLDCHGAVLEGVSDSKGLRIAHDSCATGPSCDPCHADTAHGRKAGATGGSSMEDCIACHRANGASVDCATCHTERESGERLGVGPWQVTHGPKWRSTHGMGRLDSCSACHPQGKCAGCHGIDMPHSEAFGGSHGKDAIAKPEACPTCHKQRSFCDGCHRIEMPHPKGFLKRHSSIAKDRNDPSCHRCHAVKDCDTCHEYHVHPGGAMPRPSGPRTGG
jgi:hypothetical protein